jgi:hypothetical protein
MLICITEMLYFVCITRIPMVRSAFYSSEEYLKEQEQQEQEQEQEQHHQQQQQSCL